MHPAVPRSQPFGTRTFFGQRKLGAWSTSIKLAALRVLRAEQDARSLNSLHFAYWVVLTRKQLKSVLGENDFSNEDQMLFLSDFSGDSQEYLVGFNRVLLSALDFVWGSSTGWTPKSSLKGYFAFIRDHELKLDHTYYLSPYTTTASVQDTRDALAILEKLEDFAWKFADADDVSFGRAFQHLRIELGRRLVA